MRVLDKDSVVMSLDKLGMAEADRDRFERACLETHGAVLVTGPTGSGKSTTLYAALQSVNTPEKNIITVEDPVEYEMEGLTQLQVSAKFGLTFAAGLRSMVRADPDVIMVGEIRDRETAQIAIESALTGHLVLSTLHTNDAPSAITRLRDMGLPTFLITATVEAVLAQRLVRKLCVNCRTEFTPAPEICMELGMTADVASTKKFFYGKGCEKCNNTGYKGRMGIYELLVMNETLRDMIVAEASLDDFRNACRKFGMRTLRETGLTMIHNGQSSIEEILRETMLDDL
jgi:type IV pilus assembly protein PilB